MNIHTHPSAHAHLSNSPLGKNREIKDMYTHTTLSQSRNNISKSRKRLVDVLSFIQHGTFSSSFTNLYIRYIKKRKKILSLRWFSLNFLKSSEVKSNQQNKMKQKNTKPHDYLPSVYSQVPLSLKNYSSENLRMWLRRHQILFQSVLFKITSLTRSFIVY